MLLLHHLGLTGFVWRVFHEFQWIALYLNQLKWVLLVGLGLTAAVTFANQVRREEKRMQKQRQTGDEDMEEVASMRLWK